MQRDIFLLTALIVLSRCHLFQEHKVDIGMMFAYD